MSTNLLYPAYQKFYSALNNLDKFSKEKNFFDNISSLDAFFSEFRNVTFVLQKSLAHTKYSTTYQEKCSEYLSECKWFVEKRNETTKQQPFQLIKEIEITIYFPSKSLVVSSMKYTVDNDLEISALIEKFKQLFLSINPIEVFFSARFSFFEKGSDIDIWDKLMLGIQKMRTFLKAMKEEINDNCELCEIIEQKINQFTFLTTPKDFLLINDYVYYPHKDMFERAGRLAIVLQGQRKTMSHTPIDKFDNGRFSSLGYNRFQTFVFMHVIMQNSNLMPVIMIVYKDNTFDFDAFAADIKTTMYRKINELATQILVEEIKEVYIMQVYVSYPISQKYINMTSVERLSHAQYEFLVFYKIDCELNEEEYVFESKHLKCKRYIVEQLNRGGKNELEFGALNMLPIVEAFKKKKEKIL